MSLFPIFSPVSGGFIQAPEPMDTDASGANLSTYSFVGLDIGVASASRLVVAVVHWYNDLSGTDRALTSATIGGNAATIVAQAHIGGLEAEGVAIIAYPLTAGTTATIAFTVAGVMFSAAIEVYSLYDLVSQTAFDTETNTVGTANPGSTSISIDVPAGGIIVVGGTGCKCDTVQTWTGLTPDFATTTLGDTPGRASSAAEDDQAAATGRTVSILWGDTVGSAQCGATWR